MASMVDTTPAASIIGVAVLQPREMYTSLAMVSATDRAQRSYYSCTGFRGDLWFFDVLQAKALPQEHYSLGDLCPRRVRGIHFTAVTHYGRSFLFHELLKEHHGDVGVLSCRRAAPFLVMQLPQPFALGLIQGSLGVGFLKETFTISCMGS